MVSLPSGAVSEKSDNQVGKTTRPRVSTTKKRKASEEEDKEESTLEAGDKSEEINQESTPPPPPEIRERERTPGRVGPIKKEDFSLEPDIKPFKGPKGKKVRKTFQEKEEEYAQFVLTNEGHPFHELHVCYAKGPNGSPTYDKSGFELDYHKVADWMRPKPYNKSAIVKGMNRAVDRAQDEKKQMAEIFYEKGEGPENPEYADGVGMWKDRVSKDLNIPWHKIGVEHFRAWEKKGFKKASKGEYMTVPVEERARLTRFLRGASLRK